jgi:CHAT domain-containing protein
LLNTEDWQTLKQKTENVINNQSAQAFGYSKKALILAEKLQDKLLIARSLGLVATIYQSLENLEEAASYYEKSLNTYATLENSIETKIEASYVINKLASLYLNPDNNHDKDTLSAGLEWAYLTFELTRQEPFANLADLKYEIYLNIGKGFGMSGYFLTQIIWLEKLSSMIPNDDDSAVKSKWLFEIHFNLQKAYRRIGDYEKSFTNLTILKRLSEKQANPQYKIKYLRELASFYGDISELKKVYPAINQAIEMANPTDPQFRSLMTFKVLKLLQQGNTNAAKTELKKIEILEKKGVKINKIDAATIKAVIFGLESDFEQSDNQFLLADKLIAEYNSNWRNKVFILAWKSLVALFQKEYKKLKAISLDYLTVAIEHNSKDSLPFVYLNLAKAEIGLGNLKEAQQAINQALPLVDSKRMTNSAEISTGVVELLFEVYQLESDIFLAENNISQAFQSSEKLKGRWLADKITGNPLNQKVIIDQKLKTGIFDLTIEILKNSKDEKLFAKLSELEKKAIFYENSSSTNSAFSTVNKNILNDLENSPIDNQTAVVSYSFTNDGKLIAYIWQRGKAFEAKQLPMNKAEVDNLAKGIQEKIKNLIFFKNEGQQIYDKLLKPLNLQAKHLVIIPDKSLWKIPFQALSPDGKSYLIENTLVSYAPSVSILVNQLNNQSPKRQTFQVFSNSHFHTIFLKYVDAEATSLAKLFGVQPQLNSTKNQFVELSGKSDILHFSMHAEVDNEEAFNSFLGFKPIGKDDGKLTVDDLLKLRLKKGSLVFLASCDTNNVFNGEGLVSLAWGMMGAGASTVISAQWEANDKSTAVFTNSFYKNYKQGSSAAEAMQKAALELIKNKSNNMHEPYYWADFTLNGDFR